MTMSGRRVAHTAVKVEVERERKGGATGVLRRRQERALQALAAEPYPK